MVFLFRNQANVTHVLDDGIDSFDCLEKDIMHSNELYGVVHRSARVYNSHLSFMGKSPDSSATNDTNNSGSGMDSVLGNTCSSYALCSLSTSELCQLARDTTFVFTKDKLDTTYIRRREIERVRSS